jgi:threonine dehydrogenase-like Zn-dependent dehydrogenase
MTAGEVSSQAARALWYVAPGEVELRNEAVSRTGKGDILVRSLFSAASRGTERQVLNGSIPASEWQRMRAPMQAGDFPFPVKYGYCAVGRVEQGPTDLTGREVFVLHPHQDWFVAPGSMAVPIPADVPARRATLAANMETALNALWDGDAASGKKIVIIGAGVVGLLVAFLAAQLPGSHVTVSDTAPERAAIAKSLGAQFADPNDLAGAGADIVFHTSATENGLLTALSACGFEAMVVEMSWYGNRAVSLPLGGAFHSQRLKIVSSQVGHVAPSRRPRWSHRERLEVALGLLNDVRLDQLLGEDTAFDDAPRRLPALLNAPSGLAPIIRYS